MALRKPVALPDSSDEEVADPPVDDSPPSPPAPVIRRARRSGDDLSGNTTFPTRTRDEAQRQPTVKQAVKDKENYAAAQQKIEKLTKDLEKAKQQVRKSAKSATTKVVDDDDVESEERDESDTPAGISFKSSIQPLPVLPTEGMRPTVFVRKGSRQTGPPKTSSRAFLVLPEVVPDPPGTSSPPESPSPNGQDDITVRILTVHAFPESGLQMAWAEECFRSACRAANERYITKRGSHTRSQIVTSTRNLFAAHYKFNRTSISAAVINSNRALSVKLTKKATFGYKDIDTRTGYGANSILTDIRHLTTFKNRHSVGAVFASRFNPYPLETVALEFAVLEFCANEWSTGAFVAAQFFEKDVLKSYNTHLKDIRDWHGYNEEVVNNIRRTWFSRASCSLNLATPANADTHIDPAQEAALRDELAGRTGATDSEQEPETEVAVATSVTDIDSPGPDFRSIRLGNLNLLTQLGKEETLKCDVVERHGETDVVRKTVVGTRRVYRARIFGSQDPITAVVCEGSRFDKWKAEAERRQSLFGITESRNINALIYHDELITIAQFRQIYDNMPLTAAYIEYQMARDLPHTANYGYYTTSIRVSTGRLCLHDQFSPSEEDELETACTELFPWDMTVAPSTRDIIEEQLFARLNVPDIPILLAPFSVFRFDVRTPFYGRVPLAQLATVDGDVLDFQIQFSPREIEELEVNIGPWIPTSLRAGFTRMENQWTRIALPANKMDFAFHSQIQIKMSWDDDYMNKRWLSEATRILGPWITADNHMLSDLCLTDSATLSFRLHYPKYINDPDTSSNALYLFVFRPKIAIDADGKCFADVPHPGERFYWSFDPSGVERLGDEPDDLIALPRVFFEVGVTGWSWTAGQYNLLKNFQQAKEQDRPRSAPWRLPGREQF
ncbi:hypothetical protein FB451DRAFT_1413063 [Mycena latifolia]|nr:hypothetical protein FB451DRAFT_1413063 [Mycena latifolia]